MAIPFVRPDPDAMMRQRGNENQKGGGKFVKFSDNTKLFFHLLPPWPGSKVLGKEVWQCFGLPPVPGKKWVNHIAWRTYDAMIPGISAQDPVINLLNEFRDSPISERVKKMLPYAKYFFNAIQVGKISIGADKVVREDTWEELPPSIVIVGVSGSVYNDIVSYVVKAEAGEGSLCNPYASGMLGIGKVNDGVKVRYFSELIGATTPQGVVPNRYNLVEKYTEQTVASWYSNIPNLDQVFPPPEENVRVEANLTAKYMRSVFVRDCQEAAESAKSARVARREQERPPNADVSRPTPQPKQPEDPPAPAPKITGKDIMTRDLQLPCAPTNSEGRPICLKKYKQVQSSPNSSWCQGCSWKRTCQLTAK